MYIPQKRADSSHKNKIFIICASAILFTIALCVSIFFLSRYLRQRHSEPKYIPGTFLKQKWKQWRPGTASYGQVPNQTNANTTDTSYRGAGSAPEMQTADGVRRETSIRSIMTLPPYSPNPKPTEQIIAREGERGGMDMVVEYPETAEEQETRREEQMDSLYQLRLQRRQELADREARRRERREARSRGDSTRLEQLAAESRVRSQARRPGSNTGSAANVAAALAEHQARERERRISTVSYANVGHVRHDGSRLRADSHDSDRHPLLLQDSASMEDPSSRDSRVQSFASSIHSESTGGTELEPLTLAQTTTHGSSRPQSQADEGDLGALSIPPPPEYDHLDWGDAPAYQSPIADRHEQPQRLPSISRLPSIHVNLPSPMAVSPVTPTQSTFQTISEASSTPTIRQVSAQSRTSASSQAS
ncbi:uncharacterized protein N7511_010449 [Penicillium nucicola]|uniref:uncharacterized protein n=1 Tax=Penicillium nucicola TaxID=1850975 RepID=UPI00254591AC|nr:uncharacterized protein N7511_010449 [Penicillium nucicola]KAJ5748753.1 hypothetical protein N7511_010449 [Penicillium nucicola]